MSGTNTCVRLALASETGVSGAAAGTTDWLLTDYQGSVRDVADNAGTVLDHLVYDSFGNIVSQTSAADAPRLGYTGQQVDAETGFNFDHARYYNPTTGTFLNQDPKGFKAGDQNLYRYVNNSPLDKTDPTGMDDQPSDAAYFPSSLSDLSLGSTPADAGNSNASGDSSRGNGAAQAATNGSDWETSAPRAESPSTFPDSETGKSPEGPSSQTGAFIGSLWDDAASMLGEDVGGLRALADPLAAHEALVQQTADSYTQQILAAAKVESFQDARDSVTAWDSALSNTVGAAQIQQAEQGRNLYGDISAEDRAVLLAQGVSQAALTLATAGRFTTTAPPLGFGGTAAPALNYAGNPLLGSETSLGPVAQPLGPPELSLSNPVEPIASGPVAESVATPYGDAVQSPESDAAILRSSVADGQQIYRAGNFPRSAGAEGQFWSAQSPLTPGYADSVGAANLGGGVSRFPVSFESGSMRARFNEKDGQLYVCGFKGWQTTARHDTAFERVRYTSKPAHMPIALHVKDDGIEITFTDPVKKESAADAGAWDVQQWNYHWSSDYGSAEYSVADPTKKVHDTVEVKAATLSDDGKTLFLKIDNLRPVMQMLIRGEIDAADGTPMKVEIANTINAVNGKTMVLSSK